MHPSKREEKDTFLLFKNFPVNINDENLPVPLSNDICISEFPFDILDRNYDELDDSKQIYCNIDYIAPGYRSIWPYEHYCLMVPHDKMHGDNKYNYMFLTITSLRFIKPLYIHVSGSFQYYKDDFPINNARLYWIYSPWSSSLDDEYHDDDLLLSGDILKRLIEINNLGFKNILSSIVLFNQSTVGLTTSYQMLYLSLFSALEAMFDPRVNKAKSLAYRIDRFLSDIPKNFDIKEFIIKEYKSERNIIHGKQNISTMFSKLDEEKVNKIAKLMEITRLCILGFISMDNKFLELYGSDTNGKNNKLLDNLPKAEGKYIEGQKFWI